MRGSSRLVLVGWITSAVACSPAEPPRWASPSPTRSAPIALAPVATAASSDSGVVTLTPVSVGTVAIREGTFTMGSSEAEIEHALAMCRADVPLERCSQDALAHEYPPHDVFLSAYRIDRTEVTVARYRQCVEAGACTMPPLASGGERFDRPELPIVLVTHPEAAAFCAWAGGRLPTEAEWERAARGVVARRFPWGSTFRSDLANHGHGVVQVLRAGITLFSPRWRDLEGDDGFLELAPAGSFLRGATPEGVLDLAGNVEEWVLDNYAPEYPRASQENPRGPDSGEERVVRGGSYAHAPVWLRGASRSHDFPLTRRAWRGFRCAYPAETLPDRHAAGARSSW